MNERTKKLGGGGGDDDGGLGSWIERVTGKYEWLKRRLNNNWTEGREIKREKERMWAERERESNWPRGSDCLRLTY